MPTTHNLIFRFAGRREACGVSILVCSICLVDGDVDSKKYLRRVDYTKQLFLIIEE